MTLLRGNHTIKFGGNVPRHAVARYVARRRRHRPACLGLPRYTIGSPTGDPGPGDLQHHDDARRPERGSRRRLQPVRAAHGPPVAGADRQGRRSGDAAVFVDTTYRENWTSSKMGGVFVQDSWRVTPEPDVELRTALGVQRRAVQPHVDAPTSPITPTSRAVDGALSAGRAERRGQPGDHARQVRRGHRLGQSRRRTPASRGRRTSTTAPGEDLRQGAETVIRGSYDLTYYDEGTNMFAATAGNNPGQSQSLDLRPGAPGFAPGSLTLQSALPPYVGLSAGIPETFQQSDFTFGSTGFSTMTDDLKTPYVQSWNIGVQRQIMKNTVVEARYLGNRGDERLAHLQPERGEHLRERIPAGVQERAAEPGHQRRQRPDRLREPGPARPGRAADLRRRVRRARLQPALPAGQGFTNGGFITNLQQGEAGTLAASAWRAPRSTPAGWSAARSRRAPHRGYDAAGPYPMNVFLVNPYAIGGT